MDKKEAILPDYIYSFPQYQREAVLDGVVKGRFLKRALNSEAGKPIVQSVVDEIHKLTVYLFRAMEYKDKKKRLEAIDQTITRISVMRDLLQRWAEFMEKSDAHDAMKENMKDQ